MNHKKTLNDDLSHGYHLLANANGAEEMWFARTDDRLGTEVWRPHGEEFSSKRLTSAQLAGEGYSYLAPAPEFLSKANLEAAGFKPFMDSLKKMSMGKWYDSSWQKRVDDDTGIKYFVNVTVSSMPLKFDDSNEEISFSHSPDVQFTTAGREAITFNVEMLPKHNLTISEMEEFFENMWVDMYVRHYEAYPQADNQKEKIGDQDPSP